MGMGGGTPKETGRRRPQWGQGGDPKRDRGEENPYGDGGETPMETGGRRPQMRLGGGAPYGGRGGGDPNGDPEETLKETGEGTPMGTRGRPQMRPGGAANGSRSDPPSPPPPRASESRCGAEGKREGSGGGHSGECRYGGKLWGWHCGAGTVRVTLVGLALEA